MGSSVRILFLRVRDTLAAHGERRIAASSGVRRSLIAERADLRAHFNNIQMSANIR